MDANKLKEALEAYHRFNPLHNDLEAYLWDMGEWALNDLEKKPDPEEFGLDD